MDDAFSAPAFVPPQVMQSGRSGAQTQGSLVGCSPLRCEASKEMAGSTLVSKLPTDSTKSGRDKKKTSHESTAGQGWLTHFEVLPAQLTQKL